MRFRNLNGLVVLNQKGSDVSFYIDVDPIGPNGRTYNARGDSSNRCYIYIKDL